MELENFHRYVKVTSETFLNFKICDNDFFCNSLLQAYLIARGDWL